MVPWSGSFEMLAWVGSWIVSGIVPMRWEVMSVMPVITADIMSRMIPAIMAVAHPEDHGRQDRQDHQDRPGMG